MARTQVPSRSTSASRVTLLAQGMRPLTVTVPRLSRSRASVDNMAVAARADVAGKVHGRAAHGAGGPPALHQLLGTLGEGVRLLSCDAHACGGGLLARALAFLFLFEELVRFHDDAIVLLVVAHAHGGHDPRGLGKVEQVEVGGHLALGRAQLGDEPAQVVAQRFDLPLLALERDERALLARLQVEDALARLADGARREEVGLLELEGLAHLMPSLARSPSMELTVSAAELDGL